jgi:plasmid stabilization system protein ParE
MERRVVFHRLVQRDMDGILRYYREEASVSVADRFFETFLLFIGKAGENPMGFPPASDSLRRANLPGFPYHFLYREIPGGIRVLVLRHDRRHPTFGLKRQ